MFRATQLLTLFALVASSLAQSTIDDFDTATLRYSVSPSASVKWGPFGGNIGEHLSLAEPDGSMFSVNDAACFDGTFTYAACRTSDGCSVTVPFSGSGATVYVLQAGSQGINVSVTVDGGSPSISTLSPVPPPGQNTKVQIFNVQSLSAGSHSLTVSVLDWNGIFSGMMLDYVAIHQAAAAPPPLSPSPSPSPSISKAPTTAPTTAPAATTTSVATTSAEPVTTTSAGSTSASVTPMSAGPAQVTFASSEIAPPSSKSTPSTYIYSSGSKVVTSVGLASSPTESAAAVRSKSHVGAIAGGVLGGLAVIAITVALFFCLSRRNAQRYGTVDHTPTQQIGEPGLVSTMHQGGIVASSASPQSGPAQPLTTTSSGPTGSTPLEPVRYVTPTGSHPKLAAESASAAPAVRSSPPPQPAATPLTDEQADFVNSLYRRNIPASAIALITERMLSGGPPSEDGLEAATQVDNDDVPPPSYDFRGS